MLNSALNSVARGARFLLEYRTYAKQMNSPSYAIKVGLETEMAVFGKAWNGISKPLTQEEHERVVNAYDQQFPDQPQPADQPVASEQSDSSLPRLTQG